MTVRKLRLIRVRTGAVSRTRGWLLAGPWQIRVAIGRAGIRVNKREGDGATPRGVFRLVRLWWRRDRWPRPGSALPTLAIAADDAWCEDPKDRRYNRPIKIRPGSAGDPLRRADALYDFIIEIDHNTRPSIPGRGSAVFVHVARDNFAPTAGCVTLEAKALLQLLRRVGLKTRIEIQ
jgi:L,D-peptidoglycan transpeptidase YkuD (ErfK/YbiS/YcfS/YnhG family)